MAPEPTPAGGQVFAVVCNLPPGYHQYKFIVDGEWRHDENQAFIQDPLGNVNNWCAPRRTRQPAPIFLPTPIPQKNKKPLASPTSNVVSHCLYLPTLSNPPSNHHPVPQLLFSAPRVSTSPCRCSTLPSDCSAQPYHPVPTLGCPDPPLSDSRPPPALCAPQAVREEAGRGGRGHGRYPHPAAARGRGGRRHGLDRQRHARQGPASGPRGPGPAPRAPGHAAAPFPPQLKLPSNHSSYAHVIPM
jgi:hypothetical protein